MYGSTNAVPEKKKLIVTGHTKWTPPAAISDRVSHKRREPTAKPYRLVLQFFFARPIDITRWRMIKAPKGWRKGPVTKESALKYCGVRFICSELKYALTPAEVETLQASLTFCLSEVY